MGPMFADHYTINNINRAVIDDFINVFYNPSRMICVGVGIDHSKLERIASEAFGDLKNDEQFANIQHQEAKYTGGQLKMKYGFENNEDNHISCSHSIFDDSGIFALYGCCASEQSSELCSVMVREAINMMIRPPTEKEMNRAKQALASNICFEFENIARQVQVYGTHKSPDMWRSDIMQVTKEDVVRVAKRLLSSNPTLLAMGEDVSRVPQQEEVKNYIRDAIQ